MHVRQLLQEVPADGRWHPVAHLWRAHGNLGPEDLNVASDEAHVRTANSVEGTLDVEYRAPVSGGAKVIRFTAHGRAFALRVAATPSATDTVGEGTPDWMRLHEPVDRDSFRRWLTAIADRTAALPAAELPAEVTDCSALLRYAYRMALLRHDDRWYLQFEPGTVPTLANVQQWSYPDTPLGAALFRVRSGAYQASDATDGSFAQFADARTLFERNSFFVSRNVHAARPGDLLFFHQLEGNSQYHSMIVTGEGAEWVVYHTGPGSAAPGGGKGEMRRARMADLLQHPDPRWHPSAANPNFLGVYRWNLLRED